MKKEIHKSDFRDAFHDMNRANNFSYEGLGVLYDFLEECDPDSELDLMGFYGNTEPLFCSAEIHRQWPAHTESMPSTPET